MKTDLLTKEATFYAKGFRNDLQSLVKFDQKHLDAIAEGINKLSDLDESMEPDKLINISRDTDIPIDELTKLLRPITWLAIKAAENKLTLSDIVEDMREAKIIKSSDEANIIIKIGSNVFELAKQKHKEVEPTLPLKYIKSMRANCIFIPEFDREFSLEENTVENYKPKVEGLYPVVSLKLSFRDDAEDTIGIVLNKKELEQFKKVLEFAEIQLDVACKSMPTDILVTEKGA